MILYLTMIFLIISKFLFLKLRNQIPKIKFVRNHFLRFNFSASFNESIHIEHWNRNLLNSDVNLGFIQ